MSALSRGGWLACRSEGPSYSTCLAGRRQVSLSCCCRATLQGMGAEWIMLQATLSTRMHPNPCLRRAAGPAAAATLQSMWADIHTVLSCAACVEQQNRARGAGSGLQLSHRLQGGQWSGNLSKHVQHEGQRRYSLQQMAPGTACGCQVRAGAGRPAWAVHDAA